MQSCLETNQVHNGRFATVIIPNLINRNHLVKGKTEADWNQYYVTNKEYKMWVETAMILFLIKCFRA